MCSIFYYIDEADFYRITNFIQFDILKSFNPLSYIELSTLIYLPTNQRLYWWIALKNDASCLFQSDPERREKLANSTKRYFVTGYWLLSFPLSIFLSLSFSLFFFLYVHVYVYTLLRTRLFIIVRAYTQDKYSYSWTISIREWEYIFRFYAYMQLGTTCCDRFKTNIKKMPYYRNILSYIYITNLY